VASSSPSTRPAENPAGFAVDVLGEDSRVFRAWCPLTAHECGLDFGELMLKFVRAIWLRDHGRRLAEFAILWPGRGVDGGETPDRGLTPRKWPPNPVR